MSFGWVTLVATPKSHPFEERRIKVNSSSDGVNAVKIGRAVARIQASHENAVFDCKVLSRNHAVLWYRDGEFWIKDTKSSNGTFVNNQKLVQLGNGRDSDTRQVYSGDIIQLGVEIVENANKVPVVYGCIYAVIQCFNADGKLIANTGQGENEEVRSTATLVSNRKLFQMQQYVAEAQHREKQREDKIAELMSIIAANEQAAETAWKALVNEDRLLARIEALEAQLNVLSNNNNPDKQKEELLKMIDEKTKFEALTKERIRGLIEEVGETSSRLKDMERSLETTDLSCQQLRSKNDDLETVLAETSEMVDQKSAECEQMGLEIAEKKKLLVGSEEKIQELIQMNLKLTKSAITNETGSGLARLLANAINNGSFLEESALHILIDTLKSACYLPPHVKETSSSENSSASDSDHLISQKLASDMKTESKSVESYLKTILELQTKNRELEMSLEVNSGQKENGKPQNLDESKAPLEMSPSENVAFFPEPSTSESFSSIASGPLMKKQTTVINNKLPDRVENLLLLASLVPLLALVLSMLAPIQKKFSATKSVKDE